MNKIIRIITSANQVNISRQIRGTALEGDVLLTVCPEGVLVSPWTGRAVEEEPYTARSFFSPYNRLNIPIGIMNAAKLERIIVVQPRADGTLLLSRYEGETCTICGAQSDLHNIGQGKYMCEKCMKRTHEHGLHQLEGSMDE